jgi:hypothetical protein
MRLLFFIIPYFLLPLFISWLFKRYSIQIVWLTFIVSVLIIFCYPFFVFFIGKYLFQSWPQEGGCCVSLITSFFIINTIIGIPLVVFFQYLSNLIVLIEEQRTNADYKE